MTSTPSKPCQSYKERTTWDERKALSARLMSQHPDRVPVVVHAMHGLRLKQERYLVPSNIMLGRFMSEVRQHAYTVAPSYSPDSISVDVRAPLTPEKGIYLMVGEKQVMPCVSASMQDVYNVHKDGDGLLYMTLCAESTFGN